MNEPIDHLAGGKPEAESRVEAATPRTIESEEFYELMQAYRFADAGNQRTVVARFGAIVEHVDAKLAATDDLVKAGSAVIAWWNKFADAPYSKVVEDAEWAEFQALRAALAKAQA